MAESYFPRASRNAASASGGKPKGKLVRQFYRGKLLPLRNSGNGVRLGRRGRILSFSVFQHAETEAFGGGSVGGARRQIHVQLLLPAEFMGCLRSLRKLAASINSSRRDFCLARDLFLSWDDFFLFFVLS